LTGLVVYAAPVVRSFAVPGAVQLQMEKLLIHNNNTIAFMTVGFKMRNDSETKLKQKKKGCCYRLVIELLMTC
jgi:hypothetical protein